VGERGPALSAKFARGMRLKIRKPAAAKPVAGGDRARYFPMRYVRSPASFLADSILTRRSLLAAEMNPRTLCACQSVAFIISASVAPFARAIISRIFAPLLSAHGALASWRRWAWHSFYWPSRLLGLPSSVRPRLWHRWRFSWLGAPFFWLAAFLSGAFSGATCAPCAATAAGLSVALVSVVVTCAGILLCAWFAHEDSSLWSREKASGN
jgi:hypothetical protein